ncbi:MAG: WYL domain-containing transcriptional regulator [Bacteroidales bacterium]|nr:WYL domain-containing transcriptional regulator [Bacteroidales bacterium]
MDQPRIVRELQLLMLLANNRYMTKGEICEHFGFCERTFFRYLDTFREAGFAVKRDERNVYRIETAANKMSRHLSELLHFSEEEELVLRAAIDSIEADTKSKALLKKKLYAVYDYKVITDMGVSKRTQRTIHELTTAIEGRRRAMLAGYRSAHSNTTSDRLVEPYAFTSGHDQVWCYEPASKMVKTFKVARIGRVEILEAGWQFEDRHETAFVDIFRNHGTHRFPLRLRLTTRAASLLAEEYPLSEPFLSETAGGFLLETEICRLEGAARFILGLYDDITILGGEELREFVRYRVKMMKG